MPTQQPPKPGHEHHHHHMHVPQHTPGHTPGDEGSGRLWLYGGVAMLFVAIVYVVVIMTHKTGKPVAEGMPVPDAQMQFDTGNDGSGIALGPDKAKVVVREFADFQCPACGAFEPALEQLRKEYVDTGKVRFVFFDFPLEQHKNAVVAAQAARCAGNQSHYWQMHDALYAHQAEWADKPDASTYFQNYAQSVGIDGGAILRCLRAGTEHQAVIRSSGYGEALGIHATPTFAVDGDVYSGNIPYAQLKALVDAELAGGAH
ncbi:MAG: DsbA family protein [Bacillota bacterium]